MLQLKVNPALLNTYSKSSSNNTLVLLLMNNKLDITVQPIEEPRVICLKSNLLAHNRLVLDFK